MQRFILVSSIFVILCGLFTQAHASALVCVVSFIHGDQNLRVIEDANQALINMGYTDPVSRYEYYGYPESISGARSAYGNLKYCLEGPFEEVIIIAHQNLGPASDSNIIYVEDALSGGVGFINDRFFGNINWSSSLRQVTLVSCNAEKTIQTYRNLTTYTKNAGIHLRLAPTNPIVDFLSAVLRLPRGLRSVYESSHLIAEAAQDPNRKDIFCYFYFEAETTPDRLGTSCLRNYFSIDDLPLQHNRIGSGANWLYLSWPTKPMNSLTLKVIYAEPSHRRIQRQLRDLPEGSHYELVRDHHMTFSRPQANYRELDDLQTNLQIKIMR